MSRNKRPRRRHTTPPPTTPALTTAPPTTPPPTPGQWMLTFEDEFTGSVLDPQRWETQYPWGRDRSKTGELQWYGEEAFALNGSTLSLLATEGGPAGFGYTSGIISTHASFTQTYGRFEIRCRVPAGTGLWPAFWLLPTSYEWTSEIDIMEMIGSDPTSVSMTLHLPVNNQDHSWGAEFRGPDFSVDFHTFAVEWDSDRIVWFVDGVERHRYAGPGVPREPHYLIANLAVGGNWPGAPDASTQFPAAMEVDWIRAYARS